MNQELEFTARDWLSIVVQSALLTSLIVGVVCAVGKLAIIINT
jgi:hypothetical protein